MSLICTQVPLGVISKCENRSDEMLDIMLELGKYVPKKESEEQYLIASTGESIPILWARGSVAHM